MKTELFNIPLNFVGKKEILEYLEKNNHKPATYQQIISINPENLVEALQNNQFKKIIATSKIHIADGVGVVAALQFLNGQKIERLTGVDLMSELINYANKYSLRILLIGGKGNLAEKLHECYKHKYPKLKIWSNPGFLSKNKPQKSESEEIFRIVSIAKPHFVFVAFGSPFQELWIDRNRKRFGKALVMGVGGAFAFLAGSVPRAPKLWRRIGIEWLYRLIIEPWRLFRQLRLIKFVFLVIIEKAKQCLYR